MDEKRSGKAGSSKSAGRCKLPGVARFGLFGKTNPPDAQPPTAPARIKQKRGARDESPGQRQEEPPQRKQKVCMFLCGAICGKTRCPVDPTKTIEWEYEDDGGLADKICATTYRSKMRHLMTREDCAKNIKDSKAFMDTFMGHRAVTVERGKRKCQKGTWRKSNAAPSGPAKRLTRHQMKKDSLLPPAPDVLPWDEYQDNVSQTLQKKLGHRRATINGKDVVVMPAPKGTPWKLQTSYPTVLDNRETLAEEDTDDSEE
eukprot:9486950-Pyramimonas_sp.AAC.2